MGGVGGWEAPGELEDADTPAAFDGVADYRVHSKPLGQWRLFERLSQEKIVICRAASSS